jgi:hypothetical protein
MGNSMYHYRGSSDRSESDYGPVIVIIISFIVILIIIASLSQDSHVHDKRDIAYLQELCEEYCKYNRQGIGIYSFIDRCRCLIK